MIRHMDTARTARALGGFRTHLEARHCSPHTVDARCYWPARLLRDTGAPPDAVTAADIEQWMSGRDWKPNTRRMCVLGLRQFFAWAQSSGLRVDDPAAGLVKPRIPPTVPDVPTRQQVRDAMSTAPERDRWLIRIAATTGLRRSELRDLRADDLHGLWLHVRGKGGRMRKVPVPPDVAEHIGGCEGYVFTGPRGRYSGCQIGARILAATGWPPHALRRYYATEVYRGGHDIHAVQALLGHSSIATTERYLGLDDDDLMTAARTVWAA